jgi:transposase
VVDVPSTPTARVRQLSRGGGRKNDQIDAAAAACAAALQGDGRPLQAKDITDALALLDESRMNLAQSRVRLVNQLHALLRDLPAGGAPTDLSATTAAALLRRVRPSGDAERVRKQIAVGLIGQIRSVDSLLKSNARQVSELVAASGSTLTETVGMGAITAGRLIGRTGRASRFPSSAAFANYAGAAPVEVASADKARHRLSWSGGPPTQRRPAHRRHHPDPNTRQPRPHLLQRQTRRGQNPREARRCLKRRLANHIWRTMITDEQRRAAGPGGHLGGDSAIQRGWPNPNHHLFGQVTSQTRQPRLYDGSASRLTNTEAPKGSDLAVHLEAELDRVSAELNDRPRKRLGFRKPVEEIADLLRAA